MAIRNRNDFVIEINAMLNEAEPLMTTDCCIYRVPHDIRRLNEDAFTPKVVSIGPFHYEGHSRLQNMEKYKRGYAKKFSERVSSSISLDRLISSVEEVEPSIRRCYSDSIELSSETLVKVIFVDSCFLFELFWRSYYVEWSADDAIQLKPWLATTVGLDLLLLENQLPFFVLERLFNLAFSSRMTDNEKFPSFLELTFGYFKSYNDMKLAPKDVGIRHFTDLIRTFHLQPLNKRPKRLHESMIHLQSATELVEAGVKFRKSSNSRLLDLKFSGGVFEIPEFKVEDCTEILFRNLVAFELCHYPCDSCFTDYVAVLNFLINTSKDVDVLVQNGIILNWLGDSNSVADLFSRLWQNVTYANFNSNYLNLLKDLNAVCKSPWHNWMAALKRDYFSSPWKTAGSIAAILLLFLTSIQAICSIISLF